jgi:copper(I)-binding protein
LIEEATLTASRTSRRGRLVTAALAASAGATLALALVGCSSGLVSQTASQVPPVPGANADADTVALRNLAVVYNGPAGYPVGGSAPLAVRLFNGGTSAVTLTGVSAPKAASVSLVGTPAVVTAEPTPAPTTITPLTTAPTTTATVTGTAIPTGSALPTVATTTAAPPPPTATPISITIPPQAYVLLVPGQNGGFLQLNGLTEAIVPGGSTPVTFTFSNGSSIQINVPLAPPTVEVPRATPVVTGEHGE